MLLLALSVYLCGFGRFTVFDCFIFQAQADCWFAVLCKFYFVCFKSTLHFYFMFFKCDYLFTENTSWSHDAKFVIGERDQGVIIYWVDAVIWLRLNWGCNNLVGYWFAWQHFWHLYNGVKHGALIAQAHFTYSISSPLMGTMWVLRMQDVAWILRSIIMQIISFDILIKWQPGCVFHGIFHSDHWLAYVAACGLLFLCASSQQALSKTTVTWMIT